MGEGGSSATSQLTKAGNVRAVMRNVLNIGKRYRNVEMPYTQKKRKKERISKKNETIILSYLL